MSKLSLNRNAFNRGVETVLTLQPIRKAFRQIISKAAIFDQWLSEVSHYQQKSESESQRRRMKD